MLYEVTFDNYPAKRIQADNYDIDAEIGWIEFRKSDEITVMVREVNVITIEKVDA